MTIYGAHAVFEALRAGRVTRLLLVARGEADGLEDQAGADRLRRLHAVEGDDAVTLARQQRADGKTGDPASRNADGQPHR